MVEFGDLNQRPMETPMTDTSMPPIELLQKQDDGDFLRAVAEAVLQLLMEHDVEGLVGAGRYHRGDGRLTWRNGYRDRELKTRLGVLNLRVPKLRQGSYYPASSSRAGPRRRRWSRSYRRRGSTVSTAEQKQANGRCKSLPPRRSGTVAGTWGAPWHARSPNSWRVPRRVGLKGQPGRLASGVG